MQGFFEDGRRGYARQTSISAESSKFVRPIQSIIDPVMNPRNF